MSRSRPFFPWLGLTLAAACRPPAPPAFEDVREPCAESNPLRNLYFGDLHVHTSFSADANLAGVRTTPDDAYAFALGAPVRLPPAGPDGTGTVELRIDRPLDFAAVTDHAEFLGEMALCYDASSEAYESTTCQLVRASDPDTFVLFGSALTKDPPARFSSLCGEDGAACLAAARGRWGEIQRAAEAYYDRSSSCSFTTFVAYEWSASPQLSNLHRNVIFRSATVPDLPVSYFEATKPEVLWQALEADCRSVEGCDVLAIPHNPNWSNGRMFAPVATGDPVADAEVAALRAALEPLVEIVQHKGDSECRMGLSGAVTAPDEACTFEKLRPDPVEDCGDGTGDRGMIGLGCVSRRDFYRGILIEGMKEAARIGVNPFAVGAIGSTDTHNGTPGAVDERRYVGHFGTLEDTPEKRLAFTARPEGIKNNPGGLVAVWAEANDRDHLFEAMRRRETYATSGPRIAVRMFGGTDLPDGLCERPDAVAVADASGVPMGGVLPASSGPVRIHVHATADPGTAETPGAPLARIQIIRGWIDDTQTPRIDVFDVAGDGDDTPPDPDTCAVRATGSSELCVTWTDPEVGADAQAFWYVRVLEVPSCRWSHRTCLRLDPVARPEACDDPDVPVAIQERAVTSPVFTQAAVP